MHNAFFDIVGIGMAGWAAGLETSTLVDGDIDDHRAALHRPDHIPRDQLWRLRPGHEDRANHQIGVNDRFFDGVGGGIECGDQALKLEIDGRHAVL